MGTETSTRDPTAIGPPTVDGEPVAALHHGLHHPGAERGAQPGDRHLDGVLGAGGAGGQRGEQVAARDHVAGVDRRAPGAPAAARGRAELHAVEQHVLAVQQQGAPPTTRASARRRRDGSSTSSCLTIAASRERSGKIDGTPHISKAAAVTGPTQEATTSAWNAPITSSRRPVDPAASISAATAGAAVKVTASRGAVGDLVDQVEHRLGVVGARDPVDGDRRDVGAPPPQRVGRHRQRLAVLLHDDPAGRSRSRPRRWASTSSNSSDSGAHSSRSPRRRRAPTLFGPRARISACAEVREQVVEQAPRLGGGEPRLHADAGGGEEDVDRPRQHLVGGRAQRGVVDVVGVRATAPAPTHLGTAPLEQGDLLLDLARRRHADPEAGQRQGSATLLSCHSWPGPTRTTPSRPATS